MEEKEPTIFDAIVTFPSVTDPEIKSNLESFLLTQMRNKPLHFIPEIIILLLNDEISSQYPLHLLVYFSKSISTQWRPIGFFLKNWTTMIFSIHQTIENDPTPKEESLLQTVHKIHMKMISFLDSEKESIRENAALAISRIANIEVRLGLWDSFLPDLFSTIKTITNSLNLLDGSLRILLNLLRMKFIWKDMPHYDIVLSNLYETIKIYLNDSRTPLPLRTQCFRLNNKVLYMFDPFFESKDELFGFMNMLMLNFKEINDSQVHKLVYKLLKKSLARYFVKLDEVMPVLFQLTFSDLMEEDTDKKIQSLEFFINISLNEIDFDHHSSIHNMAATVVPVLLQNLITSQDVTKNKSLIEKTYLTRFMFDDSDDNESLIDLYMICLRCFVDCEPTICVPIILPFIESNFGSDRIDLQMASLNASYSLLKFGKFYPILEQMIPLVIQMATRADQLELQHCSLFLISEAVSHYPQIISDESRFVALYSLSSNLMQTDNIRIVKSSFYLLSSLFKAFKSHEMKSFLVSQFDNIWSLYQAFFESNKFTKDNISLLKILFDSINNLIEHLPKESFEPYSVILEFSHMNLKKEIRPHYSPLFIAMNSSLIISIVNSTLNVIDQYVSEIMETISKLFETKDNEVLYETLGIIEAFSYRQKEQFQIYYPGLSDFLLCILSSFQDSRFYRLVVQTIRVVNSIYQFPTDLLGEKASEFYHLINPMVDILFERTYSPTNNETYISYSSFFPREFIPIIILALSSLIAQMRSYRNEIFVHQLLLLSKAQRLLIDLSQSSDKRFGEKLYESILEMYYVLIRIVDDKSLIVRLSSDDDLKQNIDQLVSALFYMHQTSLITLRSYALFLNIVESLIQFCRYDFCERLEPEYIERYPIYSVFQEFFENIKVCEDEKIRRKGIDVSKEIGKCIAYKYSYY